MKKLLGSLCLLLFASIASAQSRIVKVEVTHINGVKLAKPIVEYDATKSISPGCQCIGKYGSCCCDKCDCNIAAPSRPPLFKVTEQVEIRGRQFGYTVQSQWPMVQIRAGSCANGQCSTWR